MMMPAAGYATVVSTALPFEAAVEKARVLLKEEGFGVLCEIDVQKSLREKIGKPFRPYTILGACNPALAERALSAEPQLGVLLPCNVVVQEEHGKTLVSAIDPHAMLGMAADASLAPIAGEVGARLNRVLQGLAKS